MPYQQLFARKYSALLVDLFLSGMGQGGYPYPFKMSKFCWASGREMNGAIYMDRQQHQRFLRSLSRRILHGNGFDQFIARLHRAGRLVTRTGLAVGRGWVGKLSAAGLAERLQRFSSVYGDFIDYQYVSFYLNELAAEESGQMFARRPLPVHQVGQIVAALLSPARRIGLLKLRSELATRKKAGQSRLPNALAVRLAKQYAWVPALDFQDRTWTANDVQQFYSQLQISAPAMPYRQAVRLAKLTRVKQHFFQQLRLLATIKDLRDVYRRQAMAASYPLLDEIARRLGLTREQLGYCTSDEISAALAGQQPIIRQCIRQRQRGFIAYCERGRLRLSADRAALAKFQRRLPPTTTAASKELHGAPASSGMVIGNVKVVRSAADLNLVESGDILVAVTTHPEYLPAMQRAAAFVTDEGGLLCHAAIISRELGKPCIIGTKIATKVLKDGDRVEVDAGAGVVKRL